MIHLKVSLNPLQFKMWRTQPMRIMNIRHGLTTANEDQQENKVLADPRIPLTQYGREQAAETLSFLVDFYTKNGIRNNRIRVWVSPYDRAMETGTIIYEGLVNAFPKAHIDKRCDFRLREQEFGYEDGMDDTEIAKNFPFAYARYQKYMTQKARFYAPKFGGESWANVTERAQGWIGTIKRDADKHGIYDVIAVNHGVTGRSITMTYCHLDQFDPTWFEHEHNPKNVSVRLLDGKGPEADKGYIFTPKQRKK